MNKKTLSEVCKAVKNLPYYPIKYDGKNIENEDHYFNVHQRRYVHAFERLKKTINSNDVVLDIGGEPGHITNIIKSHCSQNVSVLGLWQDEIITARFKELAIDAYSCDLDKELFPFEDSSCDVITMFEVIEHMTNVPKILNEINRILKPGGKLIISTPNAVKFKNRIKTLLGRGIGWPEVDKNKAGSGNGFFDLPFYARHYKEYTESELHYLFSEAGFKEHEFVFKNSYARKVAQAISFIFPRLSDTLFYTGVKGR
ncbi:MAG: hypothetical protein DIZ80_13985 [endosymbiont of Galathealinum brachiosum]|uniref:Methyltransferase type 11 domain-containing protein n=1 Tax=endosymbiont of Galathealinum brachiosum TaxID=2200906 RepID=A0A370D8I0_9GAMM|nr:MAG: hypothetical protein DIZ80_13985 [endosymbiont of Galathealinum brachiosum]